MGEIIRPDFWRAKEPVTAPVPAVTALLAPSPPVALPAAAAVVCAFKPIPPKSLWQKVKFMVFGARKPQKQAQSPRLKRFSGKETPESQFLDEVSPFRLSERSSERLTPR